MSTSSPQSSPDPTPPNKEEYGVLRRQPHPYELVPPNYFQRIKLQQLNPDDSPLEIDLGCGDGSFLVDLAQQHPNHQFLGVERLMGRVQKVSKKIQRHQLSNCQILRLEIEYTVKHILPHQSADRIFLFCPDPWPKARHHKNRNFRPAFLRSLQRILKPGGQFLFMTDHEEYYQWAEDILQNQENQLHTLYQRQSWQADQLPLPKTDFQRQWEAQGKHMHRIRLQKRESSAT